MDNPGLQGRMSIPELLPETTSPASIGLLGWVVLSTARFLIALLYRAVFFATALPAILYRLLSLSLTITINFSTLAFITVACISTVSYLIRYRYQAYGRPHLQAARKENRVEVPDPHAADSKPGLSNYLDEFLSAIKIFGYLDRPVFHELTRTMHTRRLTAGETFLLEEEDGFCLVVEGTVQIFVKSQRDLQDGDSESEDEGLSAFHRGSRQGYRLLTEVKTGAPLSSLFSILSLFTEEVRSKDKVNGQGAGQIEKLGSEDTIHGMNIAPRKRRTTVSKSRSQPASTLPSPEITAGHLKQIPPLNLDAQSFIFTPSYSQVATQADALFGPQLSSAHPDIVARASTDSTIAIIPATAFRRLTRLYPRSTGHIVQVILTRFYRVTLSTAFRYLGLTLEVLKTERALNKVSNSDLPSFLLGNSLDRLKQKFSDERDRLASEDISKGIALHNLRNAGRRRSSSTMRKDFSASVRISAARSILSGDTARSSSPEDDRSGISAGDLFKGKGTPPNHLQSPWDRTIQPHEDKYFNPRLLPQRQDSLDDGAIFREAILQSMCSAMGITNTVLANQVPNSSEQSPGLKSFDSRVNKSAINPIFGLMDPYEGPGEADSDSLASSTVSAVPGHSPNIIDDFIDDVEIVYFQKGSVLVDQQERLPGLYYVIDGFLEVGITMDNEMTERTLLGTLDDMEYGAHDTATGAQESFRQSLFLVKPGSLAGYLPAVSGFRSFVDVKAKSDVVVGFIPSASLEVMVDRYPIILLTLAKRLIATLNRSILHTDFALEYVQVNAGQVIYEQEQKSDDIYIILNGRLRAIQLKGNKSIDLLGEYGHGESVGELDVLTETLRPGSLHAIRDSEIARLPKTLFNTLAQEHPSITMKMSKVLAKRMRALMDSKVRQGNGPDATESVKTSSAIHNLRTVGILPVRDGIPIAEFGTRLVSALTQIGVSVISLNQAAIFKHLGRHAFGKIAKLKLSQYLADLEEKYGLVLYIADTSVQSPWTSTCISQSDCILVVGVADDSPSIGEFERFLLTSKTTARKELVLLHPERFCPAGLTRKWLNNRVWINGGHHHIQMALPSSAQRRVPNRRFAAIKQRVQVIQAEIQKYTGRKVRQTPLYSNTAPFKSDFHRLARRLCGRAVALVLGGGGARGCAHVGVIRALEEAGVPIDIVGGTSIGAYVGALFAWDADVVPMYGRTKRFAGRMGSLWRFMLDLTYPSASYTTGLEFNRGIWKTFGNHLIEDFWLPFYCNTTNISKSCAEYHSSGYAWRYVRASMSLAGLLPPLCDEGSMLLDGGYIDNLTVSYAVRTLGVETVFAVDVGSVDDNAPQSYGDSLSGFWSLWNRLNLFSSTPNPPSLGDIQSRLAYVSSVDALERAKNTPGCYYMRPPVGHFGTLSFGEFDEIYRIGYEYGNQFVAELREKKVLPLMEEAEDDKGDLKRTRMDRRASI